MNKKQKNEAQMLVRAQAFATEREKDFTNNTPPKKGDAKFAVQVTGIAQVIKDLGGKAAIQDGGAFGEETENQRVVRSEVEEVLRSINRDAAAIATEKKQPGIMDRFRMPQGSGDEELRSKLRAFADAIEELGLAAAFEELEQEETPASLRQMADDFVGTEGDQGTAMGRQKGATATIPELLRDGRGIVKVLHSLFSNRYKGNIEVLAAWKTASHVQRDGGAADDAPPAPPKPV